MLVDDLALRAVLLYTNTFSAGFVTLTIPAVAGMRSVILSTEYLTDLAAGAVDPNVEYLGGAAGATRKYIISTGLTGSREHSGGLVLSDSGIASVVRVKATAVGALAIRYAYING